MFQPLLLVSNLAGARQGGYTFNTTVSLPDDINLWGLRDVLPMAEMLCPSQSQHKPLCVAQVHRYQIIPLLFHGQITRVSLQRKAHSLFGIVSPNTGAKAKKKSLPSSGLWDGFKAGVTFEMDHSTGGAAGLSHTLCSPGRWVHWHQDLKYLSF